MGQGDINEEDLSQADARQAPEAFQRHGDHDHTVERAIGAMISGRHEHGASMKKAYEKPTLDKRQKLSSVTSFVVTSLNGPKV